MKQLTREQAIAVAESGEWKDWTSEEKVKFQLYQSRLCMPFHEYHKALGEMLQKPVFTHEFAYPQALINEFEGNCNPPTFEEIMNLIPKEKRPLLDLDDEQ